MSFEAARYQARTSGSYKDMRQARDPDTAHPLRKIQPLNASYNTVTSVRRFKALPSSVSLVAMGFMRP